MKNIGIVSYNKYYNFTNYGSALQTYALQEAIRKCSGFKPIVIDYCPQVLSDMNPLNPIENMRDIDKQSRDNIHMMRDDIAKNNEKFQDFFSKNYSLSSIKYTNSNFNLSLLNEHLAGYVCGADTIFCLDEFKGFDDGYYANYSAMKGKSISYAASFGDSHFLAKDYLTLDKRLHNFLALGLREKAMIPYCSLHSSIQVKQELDPTLLLDKSDYIKLYEAKNKDSKEPPYLLYYSRRYNEKMERFVYRKAKELGLRIIEISLRAMNSSNHLLRYDAGVEEFLSLVENASYIVTNSFHGIIFSIIFERPFACFSREQADSKIAELLSTFSLKSREITDEDSNLSDSIDFSQCYAILQTERRKSLDFLSYGLDLINKVQ